MSKDLINRNRLRDKLKREQSQVEHPDGWRKTSTSSYYTERHALQLKPTLDALIADPDLVKVFTAEKMKKAVSTLYLQVWQSWKYLIDHLDPDGKYAELRRAICIGKGRGTIRLHRQKRSYETVPLEADDESEAAGAALSERRLKWKSYLLNFIENAVEGEIYEETGLHLIQEDLEWLHTYLTGIDDKYATIRVSPSGFKLVKSEALAHQIKQKRELQQ